MLGPLLGGSSYTFGLILAVALLGIGLGGLLYGAGAGRRRPTLMSFAATCALEALLMAVPLGPGRPGGGAGGPAAPSGQRRLPAPWSGRGRRSPPWSCCRAAVVAGYQFPLLIALLGAGRRRVGREVGVTYAANTLGAILGSHRRRFRAHPAADRAGRVAAGGAPAPRRWPPSPSWPGCAPGSRGGRRWRRRVAAGARGAPASAGDRAHRLLAAHPHRRRPGRSRLERPQRHPTTGRQDAPRASCGRRTASRAASPSTCRGVRLHRQRQVRRQRPRRRAARR